MRNRLWSLALFLPRAGGYTTRSAGFIPFPAPWQKGGYSLNSASDLGGTTINTSVPVSVPSLRKKLQTASTDLPDTLPPWDDTFTLVGRVRELLAAPECADSWKRYDGIGRETGGIWRSNAIGILPTTVSCARSESCLMYLFRQHGKLFRWALQYVLVSFDYCFGRGLEACANGPIWPDSARLSERDQHVPVIIMPRLALGLSVASFGVVAEV